MARSEQCDTRSPVPTDNAAAWDRHSAAYQAGARLPTDVAHYGPDIGTEADFRLLGDLKGDLGVGLAAHLHAVVGELPLEHVGDGPVEGLPGDGARPDEGAVDVPEDEAVQERSLNCPLCAPG